MEKPVAKVKKLWKKFFGRAYRKNDFSTQPGPQATSAPSSQSRGNHAFLSYSHKDAGLVSQLASYLKQEEIPPWVDNQLEYGEIWEEVVAAGIRDCKVFMVAMSRHSRESHFVKQEINLAMNERKLIIPILIEGQPFEELKQYHYVNLLDTIYPKTRFVERLRELLTPSRIPSATVQERRIKHFVLSVFEEQYPERPKPTSRVYIGFGLDQDYTVSPSDNWKIWTS